MTCESLMIPAPVTLREQATVAEAVALLLRHDIPTLPVVEGDGRYLGLFGTCEVLTLLLPATAAWEEGGVADIAYIRETLPGLRERLAALGGRAVGELLNAKATTLTPATPALETLLLLHRSHNVLPVVEPISGRLVGVVTRARTLTVIAGAE